MNETSGEKSDALIAKLRQDRGYTSPAWEFAAREDPDFFEAYNELYRKGLGDGQALSAKVREFVAIGILAFRGQESGVRNHIQRAIRLGATKQELLEAIETCLIPGGAPTYGCGLKALQAVLADERAE
jgi:alkylhydroperoxidase/carboxymuconolactone decarboxylase family protein YurZ